MKQLSENNDALTKRNKAATAADGRKQNLCDADGNRESRGHVPSDEAGRKAFKIPLDLLLQPALKEIRDVIAAERVRAYKANADKKGVPHHKPRDINTLMSLTQLGSKRLFVFATGNIVKHDELLHCVARGNKARVIEIIKQHPELLLESGRAVTYAGKTLKGFTPLQVALLEGDVQIHDDQPEMAEVLRDALVGHYGHEVLQKQLEKLYKTLGVKDHAELVIEQQASAEETREKINALVNVINNCRLADLAAALNCSKETPATDNGLWQQLNEFRAWFANRANVEEKAYNPHHILVAFEAYIDAFDELDNGNWGDRHHLLWRQVVGWVQRFASASTAQVFATSLFDIIEKDQPLRRLLSFQYHSDFSFFPVSSSHAGLGFNCAVGGCVTLRGGGVGRASHFGAEAGGRRFQKSCQTKTIQQRAYSAEQPAPSANR